ncbi:MAG TPA: hypothetical protein VGC44_11070, partial [Longimicrobiales bacterium]
MKLRLLFLAAGVLVLFLVVRRWPDARSRGPTENLHETRLARHLLARGEWQTYNGPTGHIHYRSNSYTTRTLPQISITVDSARKAVLGFLQLRDAEPIEVFFVDSRAEMQQLIGRPLGGIVQSGERTALLVHNETYSPFLVHELTHLYTHHHWGAPRTGRWISEGMAALAGGDCQGHTLAALVKGLHDDQKLRSWPDLVARFDSIDEIAGNLQAASMVEFLWQQRGLRAVRNLWMTEDWQPAPELERAWLARVQGAPASARLDLPRLRSEGCVSSESANS